MRYDCDAALVINSSSPCAAVSVPMTVLWKFFQHSYLLMIYYGEKHTILIWKTETRFQMLNRINYVADLLPWFMNLILQRTCHLGERGDPPTPTPKKKQIKRSIIFSRNFWKNKNEKSQEDWLTGKNCQNTGIILLCLEERKRPDFFELYILTFYMQQKIF